MDLRTAARPYAKAAFAVATEEKQQDSWLQELRLLAALTQSDSAKAVFDPALSSEALMVRIGRIVDNLSASQKSFVQDLIAHKRIDFLPQVVEIFEHLLAEQSGKIQLKVTTAFEATAEERSQLEAALKDRFNASVETNFDVDPYLIGGFVVHAGDQVIDASLRGRLQHLQNTLSA